MTNNYKLKSCPFCGSEKLKIESKSVFAGYNGLEQRGNRGTYSVRCNKCHARGGAISGKILASFKFILNGEELMPTWATTDSELKQKAVDKWNRRVKDDE